MRAIWFLALAGALTACVTDEDGGADPASTERIAPSDTAAAAGSCSPEAPVVVRVKGEGTVQATPDGILCPGDCTQGYVFDTIVHLEAAPKVVNGEAVGQFVGWFGTGCAGNAPACVFTVDGLVEPVAQFRSRLKVNKAGTGAGTVSGGAIHCGATCSAFMDYNSSVTLTATPSSSSIFVGWEGACTGAGACTVSNITAARTVTARFTARRTLTVTKVLTGGGDLVIGAPVNATCTTGQCTYPGAIVDGAQVTFTAQPTPGFVFDGFDGCEPTGARTCRLAMDSDKVVTARFCYEHPTLPGHCDPVEPCNLNPENPACNPPD